MVLIHEVFSTECYSPDMASGKVKLNLQTCSEIDLLYMEKVKQCLQLQIILLLLFNK
jgi:hypothetical protein